MSLLTGYAVLLRKPTMRLYFIGPRQAGRGIGALPTSGIQASSLDSTHLYVHSRSLDRGYDTIHILVMRSEGDIQLRW